MKSTYAVWIEGGLNHARNISNLIMAEDFLSIPPDAVMVEAATGQEAVRVFDAAFKEAA